MTEQFNQPWVHELLNEYCEALDYAASAFCTGWPQENGDLDTAEGLRQIFRLATQAETMLLEANPAYPTLIKPQSVTRQVMLPAADALYLMAPLDGRYRYRLHGNRGSAHIFQVAVNNGTSGEMKDYRVVSERDNFAHSDWQRDAEIDLVLGSDQADAAGMVLPEGPCELWIRQYFADWDNEHPASLVLERIDARYPPPPPTRDEITENLKKVTSVRLILK